jgi:hypothetical protein
MRAKIQLEMNSASARAPQPANQGLAARQNGHCTQPTIKCRSARTSSTSFTCFAPSASPFLIATVPGLEIAVSYRKQRTDQFLIATPNGLPATPPEGFPHYESRHTGRRLPTTGRDARATRTNAAASFPRQLRQSLASPFSLFTSPFSDPSAVISLGAPLPGMVISQSAPATGAFPSEFHALGNDSPRWRSRRKDFREGFSI